MLHGLSFKTLMSVDITFVFREINYPEIKFENILCVHIIYNLNTILGGESEILDGKFSLKLTLGMAWGICNSLNWFNAVQIVSVRFSIYNGLYSS